MQHFQVYKHNFRAHDQQVYSAASSAFPELFPSSPETVKSFKINLPFPVLSSTAKIACKKKRVEFSYSRAKSNILKANEICHFCPFDLKWFHEKTNKQTKKQREKKKRSVIYGMS